MVDNTWTLGAVDNILAPYEWSNGAPQPGDRLVIESGTAYVVDTDLNRSTVLLAGHSGSPPPKLVVYGNSNVTADVSIINSGVSVYNPVGTIEVIGSPQLHVTVGNARGAFYGAATINIDDYSQMRGGFNTGGNLTINGTPRAVQRFRMMVSESRLLMPARLAR